MGGEMTTSKQPAFADFVANLGEVNQGAEPRSFDRMMFDVCGEVNHIRAAMQVESKSDRELAALSCNDNKMQAREVGIPAQMAISVLVS